MERRRQDHVHSQFSDTSSSPNLLLEMTGDEDAEKEVSADCCDYEVIVGGGRIIMKSMLVQVSYEIVSKLIETPHWQRNFGVVKVIGAVQRDPHH